MSPTRRRPQPAAQPARRHTDLLRTMLLIRRFEETSAELYSAAKIRGFLHLYVGEEAVAAGVVSALRPEDWLVSTYREHGHALARGVDPESLMAEMYGRETGCSRGRGGSMHLFDAASKFVGGNAIVGGGLPLAAGLALADHLRGLDHVTACFFGEGAAAEGEFHETLNLAALWNLPILFCCENNLYAMGTALARSHAETDLALRAASYDIAAWPVDGMDVLEVAEAADRAVQSIRAGGGPHFLELRTYRFRAHSMYDPELYRDKAEVAEWKERDPIQLFVERLRADGELTDASLAALEQEVEAQVAAAVEAAEAGPLESVDDLARFVHTEDGRQGA